MVSYNNIVEVFNQIANSHPMINDFGSGELSDINVITTGKFSKLFIIPQTITAKENSCEYLIRVMVFDKQKKDNSNKDDILSDSIKIGIDVVNIFKNASDEIWSLGDVVFTPFSEQGVDYVTGVYGDFTIETGITNEYCSTAELINNLQITFNS